MSLTYTHTLAVKVHSVYFNLPVDSVNLLPTHNAPVFRSYGSISSSQLVKCHISSFFMMSDIDFFFKSIS